MPAIASQSLWATRSHRKAARLVALSVEPPKGGAPERVHLYMEKVFGGVFALALLWRSTGEKMAGVSLFNGTCLAEWRVLKRAGEEKRR
ncbi:hypothetical protein HK15_03170 [Acetobacter orientalis]|uniref:Uncharacterized protein n=1 Tax=Acetobacter orientalis TaxID=146474 RepID=A0A252AZ70_9PROT|nr:hypothetical protein HK15_03170 [Acetobacter orientalis]